MGTEMALREGTTPVPNTPSDKMELSKELRQCAHRLGVITRLESFNFALRVNHDYLRRRGGYYLLSLNNERVTLRVTSYSRKELSRAIEDYAKMEKVVRQKKNYDAVLVSVKSIGDLSRIYPNYFADTRVFIKELERALGNH